jgi:hypothetical protein
MAFIAPFIVRQAMFDQPELKPRSIDAIRSSRAIARAFCSASSLSVRDMLPFSRTPQPRTLGQVEHETLRSAQQLIRNRVAFVPGPGALPQTCRVGQRFIVHLQFVQGEHPCHFVLLAADR